MLHKLFYSPLYNSFHISLSAKYIFLDFLTCVMLSVTKHRHKQATSLFAIYGKLGVFLSVNECGCAQAHQSIICLVYYLLFCTTSTLHTWTFPWFRAWSMHILINKSPGVLDQPCHSILNSGRFSVEWHFYHCVEKIMQN